MPKKYEGVIASRMFEAASGRPNAAASVAWRKINGHLEKDGWVAESLFSDGRKIEFKGKIDSLYTPLRSIVQRTSIQGRLIRIEGSGDVIKIGLETDSNLKIGQLALDCVIAAELAGYFHKNIRLYGDGKWGRDGEGNWYLESFHVISFDELQDAPLKETLQKLKNIIPHEGSKFLVNAINEMR